MPVLPDEKAVVLRRGMDPLAAVWASTSAGVPAMTWVRAIMSPTARRSVEAVATSVELEAIAWLTVMEALELMLAPRVDWPRVATEESVTTALEDEVST